MARAIKRSGQASDTATERVSAGNLKIFISQILTVPVAPFLEISILLFIVLFWICHSTHGHVHAVLSRVLFVGNSISTNSTSGC